MTEPLDNPAVLAEQGLDANAAYALGSSEGETSRLHRQVVAEMVRLARPGGWVAAMEPDTEYALCYPPHPAFTRLCELFPVVFGRNGADPHIGRQIG